MKHNQNHTCRPATAKARLQLAPLINRVAADVRRLTRCCAEARASLPRLLRVASTRRAIPFGGILALTLWLGCLPGLLAQSVPDQINYQGILLDGQGAPVMAPTDVEFRIYDTPTAATGLQWGRTFKITPDANGAFNVVMSDDGALLSDTPGTSLASVFSGTGSNNRYLELKVAGSTPISPRQRFVASPYAFLANGLTAAALQNFTISDTLAVAGTANVGSLTSVGIANVGSLTTVGSANVGSLTASGLATVGSLTTTGAATVGSLTASGTANVAGAVTAASFAGSGANLTGIGTNSLVQQVVDALCPPGSIMAFGGDTNHIPSGWLLCDGTSVSRTIYSRLFSAISTNWGTANASVFNLPDLRAMFLRGVNLAKTGSYTDPNASSRAASATGGASGNAVGSVQQDALQNVAGSIGDVNTWGAVRGTPTGPFYLTGSSTPLGLASA
jgi:hypothetical protein